MSALRRLFGPQLWAFMVHSVIPTYGTTETVNKSYLDWGILPTKKIGYLWSKNK